MRKFHPLFAAHVLLVLRAAAAFKVLIIGDSNAEYSGTSLEQFCPGATVKNAAVAGSTALQWSSGEWLNHIGSQACGGTPDVIWLSVGANDNLATKCTQTAEELAAKITASINAVKEKAPKAKIVMMGYCMPAQPPPIDRRLESGDETEASASQGPGCDTPKKTQNMVTALKQVADADESVTFIDSTAACGGSATEWSPGKYFADGLHLNGKGYCKYFQQQAIRRALGCATTGMSNCEQADDKVGGLDKHCGDSTTGGGEDQDEEEEEEEERLFQLQMMSFDKSPSVKAAVLAATVLAAGALIALAARRSLVSDARHANHALLELGFE